MGVVERRRNRTVLSTTRSMMKAMKLPLNFWAEVVRHAIYILNRVPTRALEDKTPYEALYNRKPNLENLRIFGCTAYAKITIPHLKKLDDRSIPMIYLGVEEGSKSCRLYDPTAKKKHVSRDVKFMETKPWDWNKDKEDTNKKWIEAMEIELDSINKNNTWTLTTFPPDQKAIGLKWVFKTKRDVEGKIIKYKARLVAKGYVQEQGELTGWEEKKITLKVDNVSAIALVRNPVFHGRSKHIDIRYHFIRECVENWHINVEHVRGELQRADILTKALPRLKFVTMRQMLGSLGQHYEGHLKRHHTEAVEDAWSHPDKDKTGMIRRAMDIAVTTYTTYLTSSGARMRPGKPCIHKPKVGTGR
ncbi:zinc finger, CCHC-type containing protein [Tanacetum coccineum]|uniref:Zinc finger, CCHC-type containing protein n=1 Tax=Tanacetum coccineum TaxID=301880 RepID=A0ABQ4XX51_9ASTR